MLFYIILILYTVSNSYAYDIDNPYGSSVGNQSIYQNPLQGPNVIGPITPNVYGPGINSDATGRPFTWQPQQGHQGQPHQFQQVQPNVYGPGIGMNQYGQPVTPQPYWGR